MPKVKICGVTNHDDALLVANIGAEYIGFNFCKASPRKVSVAMAKEVIAKLPPFVLPIGVFVDEEVKEVVKIVTKTGLKLVQLSGNESPEYCTQLKAALQLPVIKAFKMADESSLGALASYTTCVDYFLLDSHVEGQQGGTGVTFNWDLAVKAKEAGKPIFLAGGLTPENVGEAIAKVQPFAVDVASGVERLARRKDYDKMNQFLRRARGLK